MANSVRLRTLTRRERRLLQAKVMDRRLPVRLHGRYRVFAEVARGCSLAEAADRVGCNVTMVDEWVHRFHESGFRTFERPPNPEGRRPIITGPQIRELIDIALSSPAERGPSWPRTAGSAGCDRRLRTNGSAGCCAAKGSAPSASGPGSPRMIPPSIGKKTQPPAVPDVSGAGGSDLLRRVGAPGAQALGRGDLGPAAPAAADAGHVSPAQRHRAVPGVLRCACRLPQRRVPPAQAHRRGERGIPAA